MNNPTLQNALNDCIERLANGQTIEQCLTMYPELASELRPLLETGRVPSQLRADRIELGAMRQRLDPKIESLIADTNFNQRRPFQLPLGSFVLVASLIAVVIGMGVIFGGDNTITGGRPTLTVTTTPTEAQMTPNPTLVTATPERDTALCTPPNDWVAYQVNPEDILSSIAVNSRTNIDDLRSANCLDVSAVIVEGQTIFVPFLWKESPPFDDDDDSDDDSDDS